MASQPGVHCSTHKSKTYLEKKCFAQFWDLPLPPAKMSGTNPPLKEYFEFLKIMIFNLNFGVENLEICF